MDTKESAEFCGQQKISKEIESVFNEQARFHSFDSQAKQLKLPSIDIAQAQKVLKQMGFPSIELSEKINPTVVKDAVDPVIAHGRPELINAVNDHLGDLVALASRIPPGQIDVAAAFASAEKFGIKPEVLLSSLGLQSDAKLVAQLRNIETIVKSPDGHVTITQKAGQKLDLGCDMEAAHVNNIRLAKTVSFDLQPGGQSIKNIQGLSVEGQGGIITRQINSRIQELEVKKDQNGKTVVTAHVSNPENWFERLVTGEHGKVVLVNLQLGRDGTITATQHGKARSIGKI